MPEPETFRLAVERGESLVLDWYAGSTDLPPALFLHGLGSHRRGAKACHFGARFSARGRSLGALDLRGHGDSSGTLREITMGRLLTDVAVAAEWVKMRSRSAHIVLIGVSMGAAVAAWHAVAHPGSTCALILIAPALNFPAALATNLEPAALEHWRRTGTHWLRSEWIDVELGTGLLEDAARYDARELRRQLTTPALLLHGLRDTTIPWTHSVEFLRGAARAPNDLYLVGDGDHRLTAHKELLFDVASAWLAHRPGRGPGYTPSP